mgnify:FL=1
MQCASSFRLQTRRADSSSFGPACKKVSELEIALIVTEKGLSLAGMPAVLTSGGNASSDFASFAFFPAALRALAPTSSSTAEVAFSISGLAFTVVLEALDLDLEGP